MTKLTCPVCSSGFSIKKSKEAVEGMAMFCPYCNVLLAMVSGEVKPVQRTEKV